MADTLGSADGDGEGVGIAVPVGSTGAVSVDEDVEAGVGVGVSNGVGVGSGGPNCGPCLPQPSIAVRSTTPRKSSVAVVNADFSSTSGLPIVNLALAAY